MIENNNLEMSTKDDEYLKILKDNAKFHDEQAWKYLIAGVVLILIELCLLIIFSLK